MKKLIGFTVKYYTLWDYETVPEYTQDAYGKYHVSGIKHCYTYLKNISFDIEKVKKLHPNVEIDEGLRGQTRSWHRSERVELPNNIFWGGKYKGKLIDEILVSDFNYCMWAMKNYNVVADYLSTNPIYLEYLENKEKMVEQQLRTAGVIRTGSKITIEFTTNGWNPNEDLTECWASARYNDIYVQVLIPGVKQVMGMYPYLMPAVNGKPQRVKGKSYEVNVAEVMRTEVSGDRIYQDIRIC